MAHRFIGFLLFALLGACCAWADAPSDCTVPLDALVARAGSAQLPVSVSAARTPSLSLAAMGRLTAGERTYSIWRVRNSSDAARRIVVRSVDTLTSGAFQIAARSDLFVRSEDSRGTHLLIAEGAELVRLSPLSAAWSDARAIPDPLCYEPGTTLWVQHVTGVMRVSPIDGRVLFDIPTHSPSAAFAVDPIDGSIWIWDAPRMLHADLTGALHAQGMSGSPLMSSVRIPAPQLAVDDAHRLWIGVGHQLLVAAGTAAPKSVTALSYTPLHLAFDSRTQTLWVAGADRVSAWPASESDTSALLPVASWSVPALRAITPDNSAGGVWIIAGSRLLNYDGLGQLRAQTALQGIPTYTVMAGDPAGGVWVAGALRLAHFSSAAVPDISAAGALLPLDLATDSHAGTVWLASPERMLEYSGAGRPIAIGGRPMSDSFAPAAGVAFVTTRLITGLQSFVDRNAPLIELVEPAKGALIHLKRPAIGARINDLEGHVVWDSLALSVNGVRAALACAPPVDKEVHCTLQQDLPEGNVSLALTASDDSGNSSVTELGITVDTLAPAAPAPDHIQVQRTSADLVSLVAPAGSVEAGVGIHVVNTRSGFRTDGVAAANGSFVVSLSATNADTLELTLSDAAGNISGPVRVSVPSVTASLEVTEPVDGAVMTAHDLIVRGTLRGEGGVAVNARPVSLTPSSNGWNFTARVALTAGPNVIDTVAHLLDGSEIHATRTISLNEPDPFGVRVSLQAGVAPLTVRFAINEYTGLRATNISVDFEGSGTATPATPDVEQSHTYQNPGEYTAVVSVQGEDGSQYRYRVPVTVLSSDNLDSHLQIVWRQFIGGLTSGNPASASPFMEDALASKFRGSFEALGASLPDIVASFSEPILTSASSTLAEYILTREIEGSTRAFAVYFRLGADGIWRVASL